MAQHNELGRQGEDLAGAYLEKQGYLILHRNWRAAHWEIDLIAEKNGVLHFVEVKLRTSARFGPPEAHVNRQKFRHLSYAAEAFLRMHPKYKLIRFDILAVYVSRGKEEIFMIEDVFF